MPWYIVYKGKPVRGTLKENLEKVGITASPIPSRRGEYFIPTQFVEKLDGDKMVEKQEYVLNNLIFIRTEEDIATVAKDIDGLKSPYKNRATGQPAVVSEEELQRFKRVLEARSLHAKFLLDAYRRFENCPKVRVKAGVLKGLEGRVFRIRHDRKLIISLDDMAVAISGIHHTLLEIIE